MNNKKTMLLNCETNYLKKSSINRPAVPSLIPKLRKANA